jgi:predicted nucleic acid-binding protein
MKPKVYLETTIVSYLTARPSRDIVVAAHQQIAREWWDRRERFDLFVSRAVLEEAAHGDAEAARRRLEVLDGIAVLASGERAAVLASRFIELGVLPAKAALDAVHVATAVMNGMDYLLTWNCTHLANAAVRREIEARVRRWGWRRP